MKVTELDLGGRCQCVFRDERCLYTGAETWCDNHAKRCEALGNLANYRGWRYVDPPLVAKRVK